MDEIVVAVARVVAYPTRLRTLSWLSRVGGKAPTTFSRLRNLTASPACTRRRECA